MFKGLHTTLQKAKNPETTITKHPDVTQIQSAAVLLATEKRQQHIKNIKALLNLPPKLYDSLYYSVMAQFAEFTQNLPETQYGLFSNDGGFLDHGLERAARALSMCLSYFFPQEKTFQNISSQEALWVYAVFTAALLLDVGKIGIKYQIQLCNKDGSNCKEWLAYTGPMTRFGKYYRFDFVKENRDNLKRLVTSLVARQVMDTPELNSQATTTTNGFNWIASNPAVLESWLTILHGEKRLPMTSFMSIIPPADAQVIENYFANMLPDQSAKVSTAIFDKPQQDNLQQVFETSHAFKDWLNKQIDAGKISINQPTADSDLHIVEEGVLVNPDLFERFAKDPTTKHTNPSVVKTDIMRSAEVLFESPAMIQQRYRAIGGVSSTHIRNYILINPALILNANRNLPISREVIATPVQTVTLPASPQRVEQPPPKPTSSYHV